jgi:hypothetical protein
MFEYFDRCISTNESRVKERHRDKIEVLDGLKKEYNTEERKVEFYNYIQENLTEVLEEIIDELVQY